MFLPDSGQDINGMEGLPGGAVVKGAVLQRQLCHQRLWVRVGKSLSHRAPATPVAGRVQCALTKVARCTVFPPTHWCGSLPGWMRAVLRSSAACLGCVSEDA